jgi:hypothetical protein
VNKSDERLFFNSSANDETETGTSNTKGKTSTAFKHGQVPDSRIFSFDWQQSFNGNSIVCEAVVGSFIGSFFEQQHVFVFVVSEDVSNISKTF